MYERIRFEGRRKKMLENKVAKLTGRWYKRKKRKGSHENDKERDRGWER